jgi:hypothetical protein
MREIYCANCKKQTTHRPKMDALKDNKRVCNVCDHMNSFCTLIKPNDESFMMSSTEVTFISSVVLTEGFNRRSTPEVNFNLVMAPFNEFFTWATTPITKIIEEKPGYVKFETKNSLYELYVPYFKNDDDGKQEI